MVIAYLMKLRRWRLSEAYKWVKEHRPSVQLTPGESMAQLLSCMHMGCAMHLEHVVMKVCFLGYAAEADRLQRLEVELLGASSTGYNPAAATASASSSGPAPFALHMQTSSGRGGRFAAGPMF